MSAAFIIAFVEFAVIVIASPLAKPSIVLRFLPEDIKEAAKNHPEPEKWIVGKNGKNAAYALGKEPENLTKSQQTKIAMISENNPRLYRAYRLKETLRLLLKIKDTEEADPLLPLKSPFYS